MLTLATMASRGMTRWAGGCATCSVGETALTSLGGGDLLLRLILLAANDG